MAVLGRDTQRGGLVAKVDIRVSCDEGFNLGDVAPVGNLSWTANDYGAGGNNLNILMVNRGAQQRTTEVVLDGSTITCYLEADSSGAVIATADDVYQAFQNSPDGVSPRPTASCTVRVIDLETRRRVFPGDETVGSSRPLQAQLPGGDGHLGAAGA